MLIPKDTFGKFFEEGTFPPFPCPSCNNNLVVIHKSTNFVTTRDSAFLYDVGAIDPDGLKGHFHLNLKCSNTLCNEEVICVGEYYVTEDKKNYDFEPEYCSMMKPYYFIPALPLFEVPEKTPKGISRAIKQAFGHVFTDTSASGNALRRAVEKILDNKKVKKTELKKGKRCRLNLHKRIELWKPKSKGIADYLMALKWLGNTASHEGHLSIDEIYHSFEIIEHVINGLYSDKPRELHKKVREIIKRKGKIKR